MTATIRPIDRDEWQRLAPTFTDYNYHQLWDLGVACAERRGAVSEHIAVYDGGHVLGIADVRIKRIPLLQTGIAYIIGGPLVRQNNETDKNRLEMTLQALVQQYVKKGRFLLRIQPPLGDDQWNNTQTEVFTNMSFDHNNKNIAYRTFVLKLDQSLEEIRKKLDKQWRYNLKQAEKVPLVIKREASKECFDTFCSLYNQFITQKTFEVELHPEFYSRVQGMLSRTERFIVTLAELDGHVIAGHVCSNLGDTCINLLRAKDETAKKVRASYLLQWIAISWAHGQGCQRFDLGGIDPEKNPGVYHFKKGMRGIDVTIPTFETYPNSWSGSIVHFGEQVYRLYRKARKP